MAKLHQDHSCHGWVFFVQIHIWPLTLSIIQCVTSPKTIALKGVARHIELEYGCAKLAQRQENVRKTIIAQKMSMMGIMNKYKRQKTLYGY